MTIWQRIAAAWAALWNDADTIEQCVIKKLSVLEKSADKDAVAVIATIDATLLGIRNRTDITWKELHMALADILNTASDAIKANTQTISTNAAAAVAAATTPLNAQIGSLQIELTAAQTELADANTAATTLQQAVADQTTALTPPAA